jgi:hypothetical protein
MSGRTRPCDDAVIHGRLRKAEQFWEAAEIAREFADDEAEVGDAYVTLCVHAGTRSEGSGVRVPASALAKVLQILVVARLDKV